MELLDVKNENCTNVMIMIQIQWMAVFLILRIFYNITSVLIPSFALGHKLWHWWNLEKTWRISPLDNIILSNICGERLRLAQENTIW